MTARCLLPVFAVCCFFSTHAASPRLETEIELLAAGERAGELLCSARCQPTEIDAHRQIAALLLKAAVAARRETAWRVYRLADDSYSATWPGVSEPGSTSVRMPPLDSRHEYISAGHTHWDEVDEFSGLDSRWVHANRRTLYLVTRNGALRRLAPRQARIRSRAGLVKANDAVALPGSEVARLNVVRP